MIKFVQTVARMLYRALTISFLIIIFDRTAIWAVFFGVIVGILSEVEYLADKSK